MRSRHLDVDPQHIESTPVNGGVDVRVIAQPGDRHGHPAQQQATQDIDDEPAPVVAALIENQTPVTVRTGRAAAANRSAL